MHLNANRLAAIALPALAYASPIASTNTSPNPRSLNKRSMTNVACGFYATASSGDGVTNANNLRYKDGDAVVPPRSCARVGCYNTSGSYICNDNDSEITVPLSDIGLASYVLWNTCSTGDGYSGQAFYDDYGGYNVVTGFCDNNKDGTIPPSEYIPPGPNGAGGNFCGGTSGSSCTVGSCDESSIVVKTQETVVCGSFLASSYAAAGGTISYSTSRTVTETWSVGFNLGISSGSLAKPAADAGFSFGFSRSVAVGDTSGTSEACGSDIGNNGMPGNWTCGYQVDPACYKMTGTCHATLVDEVESIDLGDVPWEVTSPKVGSDGIGVKGSDLCVCENCAGWANGGAPQRHCSVPCETCMTPPGGT